MNPYEKLIKNAMLFMSLKSDEANAEKCQKILNFLTEGGDINAVDNLDNDNTLLHWAVESDELELVKTLLEKKADTTIKNRMEKTPFELARSQFKKTNTEQIINLLESCAKLLYSSTEEESSELLNESETKEQLKYKKRPGTSGVRGQLYETKLSSLVLYRALTDKDIKKFYLGTNVDGVGDLDDVCLKYELKDDPTERMLFIQAKHRDDHDKAKISLSDLRNNSSDFSLVKYFNSYIGIKNMFKKDNKDIMFKGEIDKKDCVFVLYTPSKNTIPDKYKKTDLTSAHQIKRVLGAGEGTSDVFQISDLSLVIECIVSKRVQAIAESIKSVIITENKNQYLNLMSNDLIKKYHVVIAHKVMDVLDVKTREVGGSVEKYREAKFRGDFLTTKDYLLRVLRDKLFEGLSGEDLKKYKSESYIFKIPNTFGNVDLHVQKPQRVKSLGDDFLKLFRRTNENIVKINESIFQKKDNENIEPILKGFVKLSGGIAGLVGNLLIYDNATKMLKFNDIDNLSEGNAKSLLKYLIEQADDDSKLYDYRFDIDLEDFPTLLLDGDERDRFMGNEFLNKLWFFTNQPMESDIDVDLTKEIEREHQMEKRDKLLQVQSDAIFLRLHDAVQKWWLDQKDTYYLTKKCDYLEKSKNVIIGSPKLAVLDFVFRNKIKKNKFQFNEDAVNILELQHLNLKEQKGIVLNIITTEGFLTVVKIAQYFEKVSEVDVTFLDITFIIDEGYYNMVESEIKATRKTESPTIFVFIHKRQADLKKLCGMIESINIDLKTMIIVVSEINISSEIELQTNKKCIHKSDDNICFTDILNIEELSKDWTVTFQGQETKFNQVVYETSRDLIHSEILWMLINNEKIEIGKPLVNSRYDEIKEYCVPRKLKREEEFTINSFKDIDENVTIVVAEPGMGKSTLLSQLALSTKELNQINSDRSAWMVYINLLDYATEFKKWKAEKINIDTNEVIRFICKASIDGLKLLNSKGKHAKGKRPDLNAFKIQVHNKEIHLKSFARDKTLSFELQLFMKYYQEGNVFFLLDGFDEICPHYEREVLSMVKVLTEDYHLPNCELLVPVTMTQNAMSIISQPITRTCKCQRSQKQKLWITTRSYNNVRNALERELGRPAYTLAPLSRDEQAIYLKRYMEINFIISELLEEEILNISGFFDYMLHILSNEDRHIKIVNVPLYTLYVAAVEYFQTQIQNFVPFETNDLIELKKKCDDATSVLESYRTTFEREHNNYKTITLTENPLYLYIAAEYFAAQIKDDETILLDKEEINSKWDVNSKSFSLFEHFLDIKFRKIRYEEKKKVNLDNPDNDMTFQNERQEFIENHKKMALCAIFEDEDLLNSNVVSAAELKGIYDLIERIDSGVEKTGVVERVVDKTPRFVHLVFAEYFAIEYICEKLKNVFTPEMEETISPDHRKTIWEFIVNIILYKSAGGVRTFFDHKLEQDLEFLYLISCKDSTKIVLESLQKQGVENEVTPLGFKFQILKTALNISIEENLFNVQDFFLVCIQNNVNESNLHELVNISANSLLIVTALSMNNDAFFYKFRDSLPPNSQEHFLDLIVPKFVQDLFPFKMTPDSNKSKIGLFKFIPQLADIDFDNFTVTSTFRQVIYDYLKLLWDIVKEQ